MHIDRLRSIVAAGGLWSDAVVTRQQPAGTTIGMPSIKQRRLRLPVPCHPATHVGDYVPFYFCPRSIMLYVIHCGNHPELAYTGGQGPILHLEADLDQVIAWAQAQPRRWAFTQSNAGAYYTQFYDNVADLNKVNWPAIAATDFRPADVREGKQAEFLVHDSFPWHLVTRIGVHSAAVGAQVLTILAGAAHQPRVEVLPAWYY